MNITYELIDGDICRVTEDKFQKEITPVKRPAVVFFKDTGTLHAIGELDACQAKYDDVLAKTKNLARNIFGDICLVEFGDFPEKQWVADEMTKLLNNTGYASLFYKRYLLNESEV